MTKPTAAQQSADGSEKTFLALGDSYTIGEGVPEAEQWGRHLVRLLRVQGLPVADPVTVAQTGWTTAELAAALAEKNIQATFDLVSLLIGVNNQYRGLSPEAYRAEFRQLLQQAIAFAGHQGGKVIVLSIPDWGATPFAADRNRHQIASEIDALNAIAKAETIAAGAAFTDITPLSRMAAADKRYLAHDGLHYAGSMHLKWAQQVLPIALEILNKPVHP